MFGRDELVMNFPESRICLVATYAVFLDNVEKLRELAWSGVPPYMRPNVWRLLLVSSCQRTMLVQYCV